MVQPIPKVLEQPTRRRVECSQHHRNGHSGPGMPSLSRPRRNRPHPASPFQAGLAAMRRAGRKLPAGAAADAVFPEQHEPARERLGRPLPDGRREYWRHPRRQSRLRPSVLGVDPAAPRREPDRSDLQRLVDLVGFDSSRSNNGGIRITCWRWSLWKRPIQN